MPEPTNEELRQACDLIGRLEANPDTWAMADCYGGKEAFLVARALLSRLDQEAEAERRVRDLERKVEAFMIAIPQTYGEVKQLTGQWPPCEGHEWDNRTTAENAAWCLFSLLEDERLLKVAREAIEKAPHAINCDYLSPIHTVCGHPANSRKHAGACDADWIPPAELKQRDCNCWKSRALAGIAPAAPEGMP